MIGLDIRDELRGRGLVQIRMRPGVISERLTSGPPCAKDLKRLRSFFCPNSIDKSVNGRHVLLLQRIEDRLRNLQPGDRARQRTMDRQVIKGDRKLLSNGMQRGKSEKQAKYFEHPASPKSVCAAKNSR